MTPIPASATVATAVSLMQFNMCGDVCLGGGAPALAMITQINNVQPAILTLEEVCRHQVADIQSRVANNWFGVAGDTTRAYFIYKRTTTNTACGDIGTAILTHQTLSNPHSVKMPIWTYSKTDGNYTGKSLDTVGCATTKVGSAPLTTVACVTHLDNDPNKKSTAQQLNGTSSTQQGNLLNGATSWQGAAAWAQGQANGHPVVFGGDFNLVPSSNATSDPRDAMYWPYNNILMNGTLKTGQSFREIDDLWHAYGGCGCSAPTASNGKIDYIFATRNLAANERAYPPLFLTNANGTRVSDHAVLYGYMDLCSASGCV